MAKTCVIISFRLEGNDGVAIIAKTWERVLRTLGWQICTVAGESPEGHQLDVKLEGLAIEPTVPVDKQRLAEVLASADLVLCENILSVPINLEASQAIVELLRGRPAILHHHDLPWQLEKYRTNDELPVDDPAWRHVSINRLTQHQLEARGIRSTLIYNGFDTNASIANRNISRQNHGFDPDELVVAHPVRAIRRKNISAAVTLTEQLGGTYWLTGPTENGYESELSSILDNAACRVVRRSAESLAALYATSDLVAFPSIWEGFGNPPIEAAIHRRPAAVGTYPVSEELRQLGFEWLDPYDADSVAAALDQDLTPMLDHNQALAAEHFSLDRLTTAIEQLLATFD